MKFTSIASTALLVASVAAGPLTPLSERIARRRAGLTHIPKPNIPATGQFATAQENGTHQTDYSDNWAGAVLKSPPGGTTFNRIAGYFTVPGVVKPGNAGSGDYAASAWAGIDGDTYGNAILQAGCDFVATDNGPSYDCWYEYFPNPLTDFPGFNPSPGDVIYVNMVVSSSTTGTATLTNTRTGQTATQDLSAPNGNAALAGQNAEWIVEDFSSNGGLVPFANFGTVTFTNCQAFAGGQTIGTSGATLTDIVANGNVVTDASIPNDSQVQVRYTGP